MAATQRFALYFDLDVTKLLKEVFPEEISIIHGVSSRYLRILDKTPYSDKVCYVIFYFTHRN